MSGVRGMLWCVLCVLLSLLCVSVMPVCSGAPVTAESAAAFVKGLALPPSPPSTSTSYGADPPVASNSTQGIIVRNAATSTDDSVTAVQKQAVYMSQLLAQLNSDVVTDMFSDTVGWYKNYIYVLGQIGWTVQNITFEQQHGSASGFEVHVNLEELIAAVATGDEAAVFVSLMSSLKDSDTGAYKLFSESSVDDTKGAFQVAAVTHDEMGDVSMAFSCSYFDSSAQETNILWFDYSSSSLNLFSSSSKFSLMLDFFPAADLKDKLKDFFADNVDVIAIKKP